MSLSRFVAALLMVAGVSALGGCGFEPLHGRQSASSAAEMATVRIAIIEDRVGQQLRNRLLQRMQPRGGSDNPKWSLSVTLSESIDEVLVEESSFGTRANLRLTASFQLQSTDYGDGISASRSGSTRSIASYNILDSEFEYANLIAERDARERALDQLASDITRQVSLWLRDAAPESG